ncbi:MAG: bifunctional 5,10-methylene-tetrahydrofolate dehydrogenase/5,10-methylene-tetrahydrofolate cyclohydrolase [Firmicutes bacterium HGW-Firmicutes-12]|nr:MAG: bifunctional 5,10-methylene-tetrahydrofolate dehydrogenase/5,10-methylene-tetrahydrofolate cyclohydrolase [Firmicutes bacterium HGW-Firmicutes-12]
MTVLMNGSEVVAALKDRMIKEIEELQVHEINSGLAIIRLGDRPDDLAYEKGALKRCEDIGINCRVFAYGETMTQKELIREIEKINKNALIHGILLFRPLPAHIDENVIKHVISPDKDIDCLNPVNAAKVFEDDDSGFVPCTPEAVIDILEHYKIDVCGKKVVIIGRSLVVGKPLSMLLLKKNATVTICHTRTKNLEETCRNAEILIAGAGKAKMVTGSHVSPGQIVIDVGINVDDVGDLCGDVDYEKVEPVVGFITPVPGGVGTVTTSVMAKHVIKAAKAALYRQQTHS